MGEFWTGWGRIFEVELASQACLNLGAPSETFAARNEVTAEFAEGADEEDNDELRTSNDGLVEGEGSITAEGEEELTTEYAEGTSD